MGGQVVKRDEAWRLIERFNDHPAISTDWSADADERWRGEVDREGRKVEWRKVREHIVRRRGRCSGDSDVYCACETAIGILRELRGAGFTHEILDKCARIHERERGRIDPLVQAVLRDAMFDVVKEERVEE